MSDFDFGDLPLHEELRYARHGDLRPLIRLLRSKKSLPQSIRDYLANELEKPGDKRFRQRSKKDLGTLARRRRLLTKVDFAKAAIVAKSLPADPTPDDYEAAVDRLAGVTDRAALEFLNSIGEEVDADDLANARRAIGPRLFDARNLKRRPPVN